MATNSALTRYVTSDFQSTPVLSLASLMGFDANHKDTIKQNPDFYGSLLCGVAMHRHLLRPEHMDVNRRINEEVPVGRVQSRLRSLIVLQRVQPIWFMWSFSDEELIHFFNFQRSIVNITDQMLPVNTDSIAGGLTVAGVATAAYQVAKHGTQTVATETVRTVAGSSLVEAVSRRLGVSTRAVTASGVAAIPIVITIAGFNLMAKNGSKRAHRELAARGLLAYNEL